MDVTKLIIGRNVIGGESWIGFLLASVICIKVVKGFFFLSPRLLIKEYLYGEGFHPKLKAINITFMFLCENQERLWLLKCSSIHKKEFLNMFEEYKRNKM